jgi:hypothetical protein
VVSPNRALRQTAGAGTLSGVRGWLGLQRCCESSFVASSLTMSELLHKCMTKATIAEGDQRRYGPNWVTSRRATLKVFDDRLECGDWRIEDTEIKDAVLFSFRSLLLRIPGYILTVTTDDRTYHFGLNGWGQFWKGSLPFEIRHEKGTLGASWISIVARVVLCGYIGYRLWQWFTIR